MIGGNPPEQAPDGDVVHLSTCCWRSRNTCSQKVVSSANKPSSPPAQISSERWSNGKESATQGIAPIESGVPRCVHYGHTGRECLVSYCTVKQEETPVRLRTFASDRCWCAHFLCQWITLISYKLLRQEVGGCVEDGFGVYESGLCCVFHVQPIHFFVI